MYTRTVFPHSVIQRIKPLVVILGPTASGKTDIAIQVAEQLGAEIVSADSRLLYTGMDIGTAKPTLVERSQVPHHLIDVSTPDQIWSLAQYQQAAHQVIASLHQRGYIPLLVGGTGQYIHAITRGWTIPRARPNPGLRLALEHWCEQIGAQSLHDRLAILDPAAAASIDSRNLRRTIRALEVIFTTGNLFSLQRLQAPSPYQILQIGISCSRPELYGRIDERIQSMLEAGFVAEVQDLLSRGYSPDLPTLSAIGYGEIVAYLQGEISLEEAIRLMKRRTRIFVRRQANWFKLTDPTIRWFTGEQKTPGLIIQTIQDWLENFDYLINGIS